MKMSSRILSLFSGGGFLDLGFLQNNFKIEYAAEIEQNFIDCYNYGINTYIDSQQNINKKNHTPIEKPLDISSLQERNELVRIIKDIDGIVGGPPCQDFSIGGKNLGIEGERGKLLFAYRDLVKKVRPKFIFFENVEGLIKNKNHNKGFERFLRSIKKEYTVWFDILNSLNYGIPQDRPRIALVGFRKDLVKKLQKEGYVRPDNKHVHCYNDNYIFRWPEKKYNNPKETIKWPKYWEFQSDEIEEETLHLKNNHKELCVFHAFENIDYVDNQDEFFVPKSDKFYLRMEGDTSRKSFKRLHRFRYSPTVAYGNNEVHLHPTKPRRLSVREGLRLQSVPDGYILPKEIPLTYKFKLIGNGVPTQKANLVAAEIKRTLNLIKSL